MTVRRLPATLALTLALFLAPALAVPGTASAQDPAHPVPRDDIYCPPALPPVDSATHLRVGDPAPDFDLPCISGGRVRLSDYRGRSNVLVSFVPAAWTPVCSDQWPGYNLARELFELHDTVILGLSADNVPTLFAWVHEMGGLWFPVLSDFWPHGATARAYGVLRGDGTSERALFLVDRQGVIRFMDVHDINTRPDLGQIAKALEALP